jgi:hypothetical protein
MASSEDHGRLGIVARDPLAQRRAILDAVPPIEDVGVHIVPGPDDDHILEVEVDDHGLRSVALSDIVLVIGTLGRLDLLVLAAFLATRRHDPIAFSWHEFARSLGHQRPSGAVIEDLRRSVARLVRRSIGRDVIDVRADALPERTTTGFLVMDRIHRHGDPHPGRGQQRSVVRLAPDLWPGYYNGAWSIVTPSLVAPLASTIARRFLFVALALTHNPTKQATLTVTDIVDRLGIRDRPGRLRRRVADAIEDLNRVAPLLDASVIGEQIVVRRT